MASIPGVINAINKLSKPLQKKVAKKLGLDVEGKPGRKTDSIVVGKDRVAAEKKLNRLIGGTAVGGSGLAAYSVSDIINDLLGIKKMGDGTLRAEERKKVSKSKSETKTDTKKKVVKKTPPKAPPPKPKSIKPKKKQLMMKDKSGKDTNVKFNSRGGMLKKGKK